MNYREALPALSAITITILFIAGAALSDQDLRGSDAIRAQSNGFDALAHQVFDGSVVDSIELNASVTGDVVTK